MLSNRLQGVRVYICASPAYFSSHQKILEEYHGATIVTQITGEKTYVIIKSLRFAQRDPELIYAFSSYWERIYICSSSALNSITEKGLVSDENKKKELEKYWSNTNQHKRKRIEKLVSLEEIDKHSTLQKVWAWLIKDNIILAWPAVVYNSTVRPIGLENFPFEYKNISPQNHFEPKDVRVDSHLISKFRDAIFKWYTIPDMASLLENSVFEAVDEESEGLSNIKRLNLECCTDIDEDLNDFLAQALILLNRPKQIQSPHRELITETLNRSANSVNQIEPTQYLVSCYTSDSKMYSPFVGFFHNHFHKKSEMNYQELYSMLYVDMIHAFNGNLQSSGNSLTSFWDSVVKPDKIIYLKLARLGYYWPCFIGEFKPSALQEIWKHPDFKKTLAMMKSSLKDFILRLLEEKNVKEDDILMEFGFVTFSQYVFVLRMTADSSKVKKEKEEYGCVYVTSLFGPYNITVPSDVACILDFVLEMSSYWVKLEARFSVESEEDGANEYMNTPDVVSKLSSTLRVEINRKLFKIRSVKINSPMSVTYVKDLLVKPFDLSSSSLESAKSSIEEYVYKLTGNRHSFIFHKYINPQQSRYVWIFESEEFNFMIENRNHQTDNLCVVLVHVDDEVFYLKITLSQPSIHSILSPSSVSNDTKQEKDDDNMDNDEAGNKITQPSPQTPKSSKARPRFGNDVFEEMGLTVRDLDGEIVACQGEGIYNNTKVHFKVEESYLTNSCVMDKIQKLESSGLCKVYLYSQFKSCKDWTLTIMETLFPLYVVDHCIPKEKRAKTAVKFLHDILLGLKFLHENNILHCDVSFSNVMYCFDETQSNLRAKLIDFNNSFNQDYPREDQPIKYKETYTPEECVFTSFHDLYASALTFCRIVGALVERKPIKLSEDEFVNSCIQTLENCKDPLIISVSGVILKILKRELRSVDETLAAVEKLVKLC